MTIETVKRYLRDGLLVTASSLTMARRQAGELLKAADGHEDLERDARELIASLETAAASINKFCAKLDQSKAK